MEPTPWCMLGEHAEPHPSPNTLPTSVLLNGPGGVGRTGVAGWEEMSLGSERLPTHRAQEPSGELCLFSRGPMEFAASPACLPNPCPMPRGLTPRHLWEWFRNEVCSLPEREFEHQCAHKRCGRATLSGPIRCVLRRVPVLAVRHSTCNGKVPVFPQRPFGNASF